MKNKFNATPIFFAFLCMGFADVVGPLVSLVKESFELSNFMAQLVTLSGFISFGLLSIPTGIYQDRKGRKHVLLLGLLIALLGMIIPLIGGMYGPEIDLGPENMNKYYIILSSIFLLGAGATVLQVSGNPLMRDVSSEGRFSSNLSLGQGIKAIGSSMGFLLPPFVLWAFGLDWTILFPVFASLLLITLIWSGRTKIVEKNYEGGAPASLSSCFKLLFGNAYVALMVFAIFLYVGAEVAMSAQVPVLMKESYGLDKLGLIISWSLFFLPILVGRFTGSAILKKISPLNFLFITVIIAISGILMLMIGSKVFALAGIVMIGLGFANIFPLVFSITIEKLPERSNELSGLMVFAIVGGAFIPLLTGYVADISKLLLGFLVPLACMAYIGIVALMNLKKN